MARFGRGQQTEVKRSGGGRFTPTIRWAKNGETKHIQFLTPTKDMLTVYYHAYMIVGTRSDGRPQYRNFVSPKTSVDADNNCVVDDSVYDPIWDRFEIPARKRTFAYAVEMEPVLEPVTSSRGTVSEQIVGFEVATRTYETKEGEEKVVPAVGLIEQSQGIFYNFLYNFEKNRPVDDAVFSITRVGNGKDTSYNFIPAGDALSNSALNIPDELMLNLEDYLESLWMTDEDIAMLDALPDTHVLNEFAERNKNRNKSTDAKQTARSSSSAASDEDETPAVDTPANRFDQLRRKMTAGS